MTDGLLTRRMLAGDETAFEEFFDDYFPRLFRFVVARVGDEDLAEEITQATLVRGVARLSTWRGEASLFTWLCTLGRREIASQLGSRARRLDASSVEDTAEIRAQLESLMAVGDNPDAQLARRELGDLVQRTLDYLPPRYGRVLEWKYLEELPVSVIAERLRTSPKAAESLLTRARAAFREAFNALVQGPAPRNECI